MKLEDFRAARELVTDLRSIPELTTQFEVETPVPGYVYPGPTYLEIITSDTEAGNMRLVHEESNGPLYQAQLFDGGSVGLFSNLERAEQALYEFYCTECKDKPSRS